MRQEVSGLKTRWCANVHFSAVSAKTQLSLKTEIFKNKKMPPCLVWKRLRKQFLLDAVISQHPLPCKLSELPAEEKLQVLFFTSLVVLR